MNTAVLKRVIGLALLFVLAFLATSLLSYAPTDPPEGVVYPETVAIKNLCGLAGATTATVLFNGFGWAAFVLILPIFGSSILMLFAKDINHWLLRGLGIGLLLVGLSGIAAFTCENSPGPVIGPGGYFGFVAKHFLGKYLAKVGGCIFLTGVVISGMILAFDYTILRILLWIFGFAPLGNAIVRFFKQRPRTSVVPTGDVAVVTSETNTGTFQAGAIIPNAGNGVVAKPAGAMPAFTQHAEPESRFDFDPSKIRLVTPQNRLAENGDNTGGHEPGNASAEFALPELEELVPSEPVDIDTERLLVAEQAELLEKTFLDFGFNIRVTEILTGPVISQFEIQLERGLRLNKIMNLSDDLAIALKVPSVRIVAPIPGKNTVAIEVPTPNRQLVRIREVIEQTTEQAEKMIIPLFLGKDVSGLPMIADLAKLPHLLIAGRTGTGKSVCLNSIIVSVLMTRSPKEVRMIMIDPKMVELTPYKTIPHLMHPVVTDMKKAEAILGWAVEKMEERYQLLAKAGVRHLSDYNKLTEEMLYRRIQPETDEEWEAVPKKIPFLVIVADEMADLMMTSAKEVETHIIRLAQKSRAVGIHLVLATQKPTVDIITGLIKSNLPARIAFEVASRMDSQVVLDRNGAEKLLGNGDMLFLKPGTSQTVRGQGTFVTDDEIEKITARIGTEDQDFVEELMSLDLEGVPPEAPFEDSGDVPKDRDEIYDAAVEFIIHEGRGSVSLLQRRFSIGYGRAARLIDTMAEDGIVGPYNGSQARDVVTTLYDWRRRSAPAAVYADDFYEEVS